ncbi:MAG: M28 family peptidase [Ignavibacteriae bacterium]|nr:M28 family peptidase [Ignavibacteriota bacterium]
MKHTLSTLIFLLLLSCSKEQPKQQVQTIPPQPEKKQIVQVKTPEFDKQKAFDYLVAQTSFGPRNVGSAGHQRCLNYLYSELNSYADTVWKQNFTERGYNEMLSMTNLFASFNPKASKRILFLAHWDTRPWADQDKDPANHNKPIIGANDGASGVAVLLEIGRLLKSSPPPVGVDILFVDGEDYGKEGDSHLYLLGSKYFAKNQPLNYSPVFGVLLDMIGDKELEIKKERFSLLYAPDIIELVWSTANSLGISFFSDAIERNVGSDDHIPLNEVGIKTIDLIDFSYPNLTTNYWHTTEDTPDKCSPESLDAVGRVLLQIIFSQTP